MELTPELANVLATAQSDDVNVGAGSATIVFLTTTDTECATITLPNPAFSVTANVLTALGVPLEDATPAGGVTTKAEVYNRDGVKRSIPSVGVSGSGADIILGSTTIASTTPFVITSMTITQPLVVA